MFDDAARALQAYAGIDLSLSGSFLPIVKLATERITEKLDYTEACRRGAERASEIVSQIKEMQSPLPLIMEVERIAAHGALTDEDVGMISRLGRMLGGLSLFFNEDAYYDGAEDGVIENDDAGRAAPGMSEQDSRPDELPDYHSGSILAGLDGYESDGTV